MKLDSLIRKQNWRPTHFRVASDDINYRRFFNISELAGIRMELPEVFEETHRLVFQLLKEGSLQGLRIDWLRQSGDTDKAAELEKHAQQCHDSFQERFWFEQGKYLYDVVDGENGVEDHSLRPNQIFAISLDFPVLDQDKWLPVLECVQQHLLTPFGLRSLAPSEKDYRPKYSGNLRDRDAAYHPGTVWPWLIGPYIDAFITCTLIRLMRQRAS